MPISLGCDTEFGQCLIAYPRSVPTGKGDFFVFGPPESSNQKVGQRSPHHGDQTWDILPGMSLKTIANTDLLETGYL